MLEWLRDFFPIVKWLPLYTPSKGLNDFIAGVAVGLTVIPQGLAYASIARLPAAYGLYSAFMGPFIYCVFGTSKDISLGPTAIMSDKDFYSLLGKTLKIVYRKERGNLTISYIIFLVYS